MELTALHVEIVVRLGSAWLVGSLIGLERTYHGRPAGFRTHGLVCGASALLMLVTGYQAEWLPAELKLETVRTDPARMAQGIMTGIGFLGAGVIFQEGLTVRGLTTAASIWITAALGILFGIGFYYPALVAAIFTFGTLSVFRWWEDRMPTEVYARTALKFLREETMPEKDVRALIANHGFALASLGYRLSEDGRAFEYRLVIRTADKRNIEGLVATLRGMTEVREFQLALFSD
ncbi:MAG: MgtC/SapB family protein [Rhodospirillales bacterium]|nr:MgtC/SapB family protein [Rhodospirillales bacterium]